MILNFGTRLYYLSHLLTLNISIENWRDDDENFDYQYTNSVNFFSESDFAMPNQQQPRESSRKAFITDMPSASFLNNTTESAYYTVPENKVVTIKPRAMTASYPKKKALLKDRVMSGKSVQGNSSDNFKYDSMSVSSFKTVRREQKSAKEANHTRDMKMHLLRHIRKTNFQSYDSPTSSSRRWIF